MSKCVTIAFANQKGGVGKTTSAVNIAASLAMKKKRVLLIDCDPQGNATSGLGINKRQSGASSYDILIGRLKASEAILATKYSNLSIIPSSLDLAGAELELVDEEKREYRLKEAIEPIKDGFDFIIIDCPPSLGLLTLNTLAATDSVIVPVLCEYYSLEGLSQLTLTLKQIKKLFNPDLEVLGVLVNMYDKRLNLTSQVMQELIRYFGDKIFKTQIPRNVKLSEAPSFGSPITEYAKFSKGGRAYIAVSEEIIKRCK